MKQSSGSSNIMEFSVMREREENLEYLEAPNQLLVNESNTNDEVQEATEEFIDWSDGRWQHPTGVDKQPLHDEPSWDSGMTRIMVVSSIVGIWHDDEGHDGEQVHGDSSPPKLSMTSHPRLEWSLEEL